MNAATADIPDGDDAAQPPEEDLLPEAPQMGEDDQDRLAVVREVLPATLRWLYILRICLYSTAGLLAIFKVIFAPTVSAFLLDLLTDSPAARHLLENWIHALTSIVGGLLAGALSLVLATFYIQARLLAQAGRRAADPDDEFTPTPGKFPLLIRTFEKEATVAILTGVLTFGISQLLSPGAFGTASALSLLAGIAAGGLNTFYFHLLFLLREPPIYTAEHQYREVIEHARSRLADGSMRLPEALIGRFEADYHRTAVAGRGAGSSPRQVQEARRQLRARLWVIDRVVPRNQLVAFTEQARTDANLLERWTEEIDWLVNASREVRRRQNFGARVTAMLRPEDFARQTMEERKRFTAVT